MSQQYLLPCACGQSVRVGNAQAGATVSCSCGKTLAVPTLRGLRQLERVPQEAAAAKRLHWSPVHGTVFAAALVLATVGICFLAYNLFFYSQIVGWVGEQKYDYTTDRTQEVLKHAAAEIDAEVDKLSPEETLAKLRETEAEGIGEKATLPWVVYKKQAEFHLWWIQVGSALAAGGVLLVLAALFIGRK
jgi:hypothetical protein